MNRPTMAEFDGWKNTAVGAWYFHHYLQGFADIYAMENGRAVGNRGASMHEDYMILAKQAGIVEGVESVINGISEEDELLDPFAEERNQDDETHLDRQEPDNQASV